MSKRSSARLTTPHNLPTQAAAKNPDSQRFTYISADVSEPDYATAVLEEATKWNNRRTLDIVWCIAGMSRPELFMDMDMASMRRQMDINFYGTAEMSHAILKEWLHPDAPVEKAAKHLIMTSSVVGFYTIPGYASYAPGKFALRGLADTLAQEVMMYPQNVKVQVVWPGTILSPGFVEETKTKPEITKIIEEVDPKNTPDEVAEAAIRGLEKGNYYVPVTWLGESRSYGSSS
jgi:3-dehydrosphinganine reductase